jgi:hypothetical protein
VGELGQGPVGPQRREGVDGRPGTNGNVVFATPITIEDRRGDLTENPPRNKRLT